MRRVMVAAARERPPGDRRRRRRDEDPRRDRRRRRRRSSATASTRRRSSSQEDADRRRSTRAVGELLDDEVARGRLRGPVADRPARRARRLGEHPARRHRPSASVMARRLGLPVGARERRERRRDRRVARSAPGRGTKTMVMLTLGTGVGGGVDRRRAGSTAAGPELGHMVVVARRRRCQGAAPATAISRRYASGVRATRLAQEAFGPAADAHRLVRARAGGRRRGAARSSAASAGTLGPGSATLVNIFDPELVVIGGGFAAARSSGCSRRRSRCCGARR